MLNEWKADRTQCWCYVTNLSLHSKPLQDFVFWCHFRVILSKTPVDQFVGFVLMLVFLQEGFLSLKNSNLKNNHSRPLTSSFAQNIRQSNYCTDKNLTKFPNQADNLDSLKCLFSALALSPRQRILSQRETVSAWLHSTDSVSGCWAVTPGCSTTLGFCFYV